MNYRCWLTSPSSLAHRLKKIGWKDTKKNETRSSLLLSEILRFIPPILHLYMSVFFGRKIHFFININIRKTKRLLKQLYTSDKHSEKLKKN